MVTGKQICAERNWIERSKKTLCIVGLLLLMQKYPWKFVHFLKSISYFRTSWHRIFAKRVCLILVKKPRFIRILMVSIYVFISAECRFLSGNWKVAYKFVELRHGKYTVIRRTVVWETSVSLIQGPGQIKNNSVMLEGFLESP